MFGSGGEMSNAQLLQQRECVLSIAQFLQQNPRASQAQISAQVEKSVVVFAARVRALETARFF
ncbi:unnamed protein product [Menidia menidia]|uniref:(Atlantic silverside) hypothetical protein n=1 Tax=Menidia menidia TaxID=238744 RepID=A0A8S4B4C4_9TELE|nr:unnamed protein product [Menidia menidia]